VIEVESGVVVVKDMISQQDADKVLNAILAVWGISRAEINLEKKKALFTYDERMASSHDFAQAVVDSGYHISTDEISSDKLNLTGRGESNEGM
jgi:copper chaperone CopZ